MRLRLTIFLTAILLSIAVSGSVLAADTLPASIPDQAFWRMISDFSEPGGSFDFEMYMSNEVTFQTILPELVSRVPTGGVYLGVAPEQNFTYIAALRPKIAFIIDIRRENLVEHLMYKAMFEMSPTRADFVGRLFSRRMPSGINPQVSVETLFATLGVARPDAQLFELNLQAIKDHLQKTRGFVLTAKDLRTLDYIYRSFFRGGPDESFTTYGTTYRLLMLKTDAQNRNRNFLASDASYQFVRQMQQKNLIVPVVGDFAGPKAVRAISGYVRDHGAAVTAFYVSNVEEYITSPQSVWLAYCRNLATLPINTTSTFIRFGRAGRGSFLGPMASFIKGCPQSSMGGRLF